MVYIGIDLGGTNIAAGIVDENGKILIKGEVPTKLERGPKPICEDMGKLCLDLIEKAGLSLDDVEAVGMGVPGIANNETGVVIFCTNLGWHDVPVREYMAPYIQKPLFIENDATVAGLAESVAGVTQGAKTSIFLTLGTGVGGGIILDGKAYSGPHHIASELGHMIIEAEGDLCTCGNKGCFERYASGWALIRWGNEVMPSHPESLLYKETDGDPDKMTARVVLDAAKAGDEQAMIIFDRYVNYMSIGITNIINFIDPEIIALGGGVSRAGEFLLHPVREAVAKRIFYKNEPYARIELSTMGNDAGIIGAAMLGRDNTLAN
jgi:glucokinase